MFQKSDFSIIVESNIYCIVEGDFPELEREDTPDIERITIRHAKFIDTYAERYVTYVASLYQRVGRLSI